MTDGEQDELVSIRRSESRDVHPIMQVDRLVSSAPWSQDMTITQTTGDQRVHFVAEADGRIIGHGGIALLAGDAHITSIAVDPTKQRRGYGQAVLTRLIDAACENECDGITLEVRASNAAAIALYEAAGFTSAGVRRGYYQNNGEDAVIMWKDLRPHGNS